MKYPTFFYSNDSLTNSFNMRSLQTLMEAVQRVQGSRFTLDLALAVASLAAALLVRISSIFIKRQHLTNPARVV